MATRTTATNGGKNPVDAASTLLLHMSFPRRLRGPLLKQGARTAGDVAALVLRGKIIGEAKGELVVALKKAGIELNGAANIYEWIASQTAEAAKAAADEEVEALNNTIAGLQQGDAEAENVQKGLVAEVNELKVRLDGINADNGALRRENGQVRVELDATRRELGKVREHGQAAQEALVKAQAAITALDDRNRELDAGGEELLRQKGILIEVLNRATTSNFGFTSGVTAKDFVEWNTTRTANGTAEPFMFAASLMGDLALGEMILEDRLVIPSDVVARAWRKRGVGDHIEETCIQLGRTPNVHVITTLRFVPIKGLKGLYLQGEIMAVGLSPQQIDKLLEPPAPAEPVKTADANSTSEGTVPQANNGEVVDEAHGRRPDSMPTDTPLVRDEHGPVAPAA